MLQRYDISMDNGANRLLIKEFAVIGRKPRKSEDIDMTLQNFSLIHEVTYDGDIIRAAIQEGSEALISEFRSDDFFPYWILCENYRRRSDRLIQWQH